MPPRSFACIHSRLEKNLQVDSAGTHDYHLGEPPEHRHKLKLFLAFAGQVDADVPDPYCGGSEGFEQVLDMVEAASRGLLDHVRDHLLRVST